MMKVENAWQYSPGAQLMAIEVISELLVSTSPRKLGQVLTEHLRELSGARTVMVLAHRAEPATDELLDVSPLRRAKLFSPAELNNFCYEMSPEELPFLPEALPADHLLRAQLLRTCVQSMARYPLRAGGELVGFLLLFDLPGLGRIAETNRIIHLLAPPIALALKNALAFRLIEQQAAELEMRMGKENSRLEAQLLQAQKMESVGRLAGGVAHDFNNMLSVILGHANLALMDSDPTQPVHVHLEEIHKAAERSADLTRQLLAFARKQTVAPKILNLNETVAGMLKMLQRIIGEDISLNWQPGAGLWAVKVDPSQIDQILANLCVNARDSIADVGSITIEMGNSIIDEGCCAQHAYLLPGEYVRIAVSDNGCGMDQETLAQIFEPFFTTKGVGEGTGLGLSTVYGAIKQNNGFINVYSEQGLGTTFTIYLPRYLGKELPAAAEGVAESLLRGRETILLVEDEPANLNVISMLLTRQGYAVLAANSPGKAIELAREHAGGVHLLMTDVVMPEMNGRDLAEKLLSLYPDLKRLFMSGYTDDVVAHHGVLEEGMHFIQKPFSMLDLAAKVREVLNGK